MTHNEMDQVLRFGFNNTNTQSTWRLFVTAMITTLLLFLAGTATAQVRLDNTIKKVETYVNEKGEVKRRMVDAVSVIPGDELQYTVRFLNEGEVVIDAGTIVITDAIPPHTTYVEGTAFGSGTEVLYSVDGAQFANPADLLVRKDNEEVIASAKDYNSIRWTFAPELKPGESSYVTFNVRLN